MSNPVPAGPDLAPYLFYDDVAAATRFLESAFGFRRIFESPARDGSGGLEHAQLAHGAGKVMLGTTGKGLRMVKAPRHLDALHAGVYVYVDDVDAHCTTARAAGAEILLPPGDQPWGDRMYCAVDPEGQFWMFAGRSAERKKPDFRLKTSDGSKDGKDRKIEDRLDRSIRRSLNLSESPKSKVDSAAAIFDTAPLCTAHCRRRP